MHPDFVRDDGCQFGQEVRAEAVPQDSDRPGKFTGSYFCEGVPWGGWISTRSLCPGARACPVSCPIHGLVSNATKRSIKFDRKWTAFDRRHEPRRGERVPYVIVSGPPGVPLIRLVRSPYDFLNDASLRPNSIYYITKVIIPPVNRCFNLIGADLTGWFNQMPRRHFQYLRNASPVKRNTISQYFQSNSCAACSAQTQKSLCDRCVRRPQRTAVVLHEKVRLWEEAFRGATLVSSKKEKVGGWG